MSGKVEYGTEQSLVTDFLASGDDKTFNQLLKKHESPIRSIVIATLGVHFRSEADDACQEVYIKLYEKANSYSGKSKFSTWLYRLVKNAVIDYQRTHTRHLATQAYEDEEMIDWHMPKEKINEQVNQSINEFVERLPLQYRTVVYMYYWQGKTTTEVSKHLLVSQGTIKGYLHRIRKQIAIIIEDHDI
ncbi:RNA polymerase sigma factor [Litorilituus lipolyticus]|uniref:RNA polymerase sigma factor n=1 Tax=Litorilituus lipolyticus TaxID=2491017 RepID=A0A502KQN9_9GAMM|nr:RNA polymerase sigma factor [Litorilituus lipolyticus]TPH13978.1 RNA polymerase sigma factor [Litorilituus lipolyticus]